MPRTVRSSAARSPRPRERGGGYRARAGKGPLTGDDRRPRFEAIGDDAAEQVVEDGEECGWQEHQAGIQWGEPEVLLDVQGDDQDVAEAADHEGEADGQGESEPVGTEQVERHHRVGDPACMTTNPVSEATETASDAPSRQAGPSTSPGRSRTSQWYGRPVKSAHRGFTHVRPRHTHNLSRLERRPAAAPADEGGTGRPRRDHREWTPSVVSADHGARRYRIS